jgi:two-component sensor histidine kinase
MWDAERLRLAADAAGIALWSWNIDTDALELDQRSHDLCRLSSGGSKTLNALSGIIHGADLERFRTSLTKTIEIPGRYEIDFRVVHPEGIRWISARGEGKGKGMVGRTMFAVFLDVTMRKESEQTRDLIFEEMGHRIKNIFSITSALTAIAARSALTASDMAGDLSRRILALGNAHDLFRQGVTTRTSGRAFLATLLNALLAPYFETGTMGNRVEIISQDILIGESASASVALIVHEMATNSIKHGALSTSQGTVVVSCRDSENDVVMTWTEAGGPVVTTPSKRSGFGTRLIAECVSRQLRGHIEYNWKPTGLSVLLRINRLCLDG